MSMTEILLGLIITIIVTAGVAFVFTSAREKNNQQKTMNHLLQLRANIEQLFNNGNFTGLTNDVLVKTGIIPAELQRNGSIQTPWGAVTFTAGTGGGNYTIKLDSLNTSACLALATLSPTSWEKIEVNGTALYERSTNDPIDNVEMINACANPTNVIIYTAP